MSKFKRLTFDNPQGNYQFLHNMTGIDANKEVYLRDFNGEGDLNLMEYCNLQCKEKCGRESIDAPAVEYGDYMDCDCVVSMFYAIAVGHAELRAKLSRYEDTGLSPEDLKERTCEWSEDDSGMWICSKCDMAWEFTHDGLVENEVNYCHKCGRKIVKIVPYAEEVDKDEERD